MKKLKSVQDLPIDSTRLCCNFVNTVYAWKGNNQSDFLTDYNAFVEWCVKLSVFDSAYLNELKTLAIINPDEATAALIKIREIRTLLHEFISAIAKNDQERIPVLLVQVNPFLVQALSKINLDFSGNGFVIAYKTDEVSLISPVWVVLKSLYDLLTTDDMVRIKECPTCGWVFFDETKNGKRRWCNPLNCGTKDKMDRYTKKAKAKISGDDGHPSPPSSPRL